MMRLNAKIVLLVFFFASFIGLFTYRMGCNPAVADKCKAYNLIEGRVYGYSVSKTTCKEQNMHKCYVPKVLAHYGTHNASCHFESGDIVAVKGDAETTSEEYHVGETYHLLQSKTDPAHCFTMRAVTTSWYTSMVFLFLAGICLGLVLRSIVVEVIEKRNAPESGGYENIDELVTDDNDFTARPSDNEEERGIEMEKTPRRRTAEGGILLAHTNIDDNTV